MKLRRKKGESDSAYRNRELLEIEKDLKESKESELKDLRNLVKWGRVPANPTYFFKVGEEVVYGAHQKTVVKEVIDNGVIYLVETYNDSRNDPNKAHHARVEMHKVSYEPWVNLRKKLNTKDTPVLHQNEEVFLNYMQTGMTHFWSLLYFFGVDMNPAYQRELVWELEDKVKLIDSIFSNVDIGKFVFRQLPERTSIEAPYYEVVDGKQRLSAIKDFYEDRFKYKGLTFSELNFRDQAHFETYPISVANVQRATDQQIYKLFVRLNTGGKAVSEEQINKVKELIKER
jgi:cyanate lyase